MEPLLLPCLVWIMEAVIIWGKVVVVYIQVEMVAIIRWIEMIPSIHNNLMVLVEELMQEWFKRCPLTMEIIECIRIIMALKLISLIWIEETITKVAIMRCSWWEDLVLWILDLILFLLIQLNLDLDLVLETLEINLIILLVRMIYKISWHNNRDHSKFHKMWKDPKNNNKLFSKWKEMRGMGWDWIG